MKLSFRKFSLLLIIVTSSANADLHKKLGVWQIIRNPESSDSKYCFHDKSTLELRQYYHLEKDKILTIHSCTQEYSTLCSSEDYQVESQTEHPTRLKLTKTDIITRTFVDGLSRETRHVGTKNDEIILEINEDTKELQLKYNFNYIATQPLYSDQRDGCSYTGKSVR